MSGIRRVDGIGEAIADGVAPHARCHPGERGTGVDGVVAIQCLMATESFLVGYYSRRCNVRCSA